MAEVVAQLEKQLESERKELAYARLSCWNKSPVSARKK
jgi:hypothetical protein